MPPSCMCFRSLGREKKPRRRMSWLTPSIVGSRNTTDKVLREGNAQLVGGSGRLLPCLITLTAEHFVFAVNGSHELSIPWRYIFGCHCLRGRQGKSKSAYFCIYVYPPTKKKKMGDVCQRQVITFAVDSHNNFTENMELAKTWQTVILDCITNSVPEQLRISNPHLPYIVFLNRKSGAGHAFTIFEKNINPVFGEADVPYKLMLTERANHAREMCRSLDASQYRGIVVVSGDGLIYEVLNGLFEREDWREVVPKIPIGVVAGGSGNGLASALCYASGLSMIENIHMHNALILAKPMLQKMDVVRVQTREQSIISFLSITWAMIADIDIQSERLRPLGGARFTVAAIAKVLSSRTYRGTISFLPADDYNPDKRLPAQRRRMSSSVSPIPVPRHSSMGNIHSRWQRKSGTDVFSASYTAPRRLQRSLTLPTSDGSGFSPPNEDQEDLDDVDRQPPSVLCFSSDASSSRTNVNPNRPMDGTLLPPLDESLPDNWVSITDDFLVFCATYQTHIATDAFIMPHATLEDGLIHLMLIRTGASRSVVFNILTSLEEGQHVNSPYLEMIACHAFRLTPHTPDGIISVDGERVDYGPIQAEVHSQKVTVITNNNDVKNVVDPSEEAIHAQPYGAATTRVVNVDSNNESDEVFVEPQQANGSATHVHVNGQLKSNAVPLRKGEIILNGQSVQQANGRIDRVLEEPTNFQLEDDANLTEAGLVDQSGNVVDEKRTISGNGTARNCV